MSEEIKLVRIQFRRDTANNWKGVNPVLADGEMGVESDTNKFKFGNGTSTWNELGYASSEAGNIPTKLSELENDTGFITLSGVEVAGFIKQDALTNYALKSEVPTDETVAEWGYTKNEGTVKSVNNIEPDENGSVKLAIPSKTSDLENDSDFTTLETIDKNGYTKTDETSIIGAPNFIYGSTRENTNVVLRGSPYCYAGYSRFKGKVLTDITFLVKAAGTLTVGFYPVDDIFSTVDQYSNYKTLFTITTTSSEVSDRITFKLDNTDNRVTINPEYFSEENSGVLIPEIAVVGFGIPTDTNSIWSVYTAKDSPGWRDSADSNYYGTYGGTKITNVSLTGTMGFILTAKAPITTDNIVQEIKKTTFMREQMAHVAPTEEPNTVVVADAAPYIYRTSSTLQNRYIKAFGCRISEAGKKCRVFLGGISGAGNLIVKGDCTLAFTITATDDKFTTYKLDGSDPRVEMNPEVLTADGRLYVDNNHTLAFGQYGATDESWMCITNQDDLIKPREIFYSTRNYRANITANYSTTMPGGCLAFNILTEYEDTLNRENTVNPLKGLRVSILGDSISTFASLMPTGYAPYYPCADLTDPDQTYWMQVIHKGDMVLGQNCGWAGSTVTGNSSDTSSGEAGCSTKRISDLALNGIPDIVICYIGINDIRTNVAKGSFTFDSALPAEGDIPTFSEAYALMVSKIMNMYRHARVFCCSVMESRNTAASHTATTYPFTNDNEFTIPQLNNCIKDICLCLGANFVDLNACGINFWNLEEYCQDSFASSRAIHPNVNGHKLMAEKIYSCIANAYNVGR